MSSKESSSTSYLSQLIDDTSEVNLNVCIRTVAESTSNIHCDSEPINVHERCNEASSEPCIAFHDMMNRK